MNIRDLIPWRHPERTLEKRQGQDDVLGGLHDEVSRIFDDFFRGLSGATMSKYGAANFVPAADVKETEHEVIVQAELPGIDEKDLDVTFSNGMLTIRGEKREKKEERDEQYYYAERHFGSFLRQIPVAGEIEEDKINARYKKGVLEVHLPKSQRAREARRRIEIRKG